MRRCRRHARCGEVGRRTNGPRGHELRGPLASQNIRRELSISSEVCEVCVCVVDVCGVVDV